VCVCVCVYVCLCECVSMRGRDREIKLTDILVQFCKEVYVWILMYHQVGRVFILFTCTPTSTFLLQCFA